MQARSAVLPPPDRAASGVEGPTALDWKTAVATAQRMLPPGPEVDRAHAQDAVRSLRRFSVEAESHVRELTGMGLDLPAVRGAVVDRPNWVRAAAGGLSRLTDAALAEGSAPRSNDLLAGLNARGAGLQAGAVLAYLGGKVLGQFDPFGDSDVAGQRGQLLLVAPNIVAAERALGVSPEDFRMWVCLHESTHRLQFNAVPWLREHFTASLGALLTEVETTSGEVLTRLPAAVREARSDNSDRETSPGVLGLVELLQSPSQRDALDRVLAVSTLLEGHADHVMDAVGPRVVPTVSTIRQRFTERRNGGGLLDRLLRSLLGVDAKIKQYAQGAAFTRHVVDRVGMDGFNAVWNSPQELPTRAELVDPPAWVRRVHG